MTNARHKITGIHVFPLGWTDDELAEHDELLNSVIEYASGGFDLGLSDEAMEADIVQRFSDVFGQVQIEYADDEMHLICEPLPKRTVTNC